LRTALARISSADLTQVNGEAPAFHTQRERHRLAGCSGFGLHWSVAGCAARFDGARVIRPVLELADGIRVRHCGQRRGLRSVPVVASQMMV
jgi:hypothetical protein